MLDHFFRVTCHGVKVLFCGVSAFTDRLGLCKVVNVLKSASRHALGLLHNLLHFLIILPSNKIKMECYCTSDQLASSAIIIFASAKIAI